MASRGNLMNYPPRLLRSFPFARNDAPVKIVALALFLIILDQVVKQAVKNLPQPLQTGPVTLQASHNQLAIFNLPIPNPIIATISFLILIVLIIWISKTSSRVVRWTLTVMIAGGVSNLVDRIYTSGVTDIASIGTLNFNLADIYIFIGAIILLINLQTSKPSRTAV